MGNITNYVPKSVPFYTTYIVSDYDEQHENNKKKKHKTHHAKPYGWKRSKHHKDDKYHNFKIHSNLKNINKVDLRSNCPAVYDQGQLGSCTANAIGSAYEFDQIKQKEENYFIPSRLFIYYNERKMENNIDKDVGASIKDGVSTLENIGVCPETLWPYDISKFAIEPPQNCYDIAKHHTCVEYKRVPQNLDQMKQCLLEGLPFVFGFEVYESFESEEVAKTGMMPMPQQEDKVLGGHAVMCCGFDDEKKVFIVRNSWGSNWGDGGYFYMPYDYITNSDLADDFWTIVRVKDDNM